MVQPTPIKRRLTLVISLTSLTVLALTAAAFVAYELAASTQKLQRSVRMAAQLIADQAAPFLSQKSPGGARQLLASLRFVRGIHAAVLYGPDGKSIATFPDQPAFESGPPAVSRKALRRRLTWTEPVMNGTERVGNLFLEADLTPAYSRLHLYIWVGVLVMSASFLVALFLSTHLQRSISQPILDLAELARQVSGRRDYSVRARKVRDDEVGILTEAFNHMLGQIEDREAALHESTDRLRLALQAAQIGIWEWHLESDRLVWDESVYQQCGIQADEKPLTLGRFLEAVHAADRE